MMSGWSVSSMMMFIPDRRITSCSWLRRSLIVPYLGMNVLTSYPFSWIDCGRSRPSTDIGDSGRYGAISWEMKSTFLMSIKL